MEPRIKRVNFLIIIFNLSFFSKILARPTKAKISANSKSANPTASKINGGPSNNGTGSTRILRSSMVGKKRTQPKANNDGTEETEDDDDLEIIEPPPKVSDNYGSDF
jgi:hypothetical protein